MLPRSQRLSVEQFNSVMEKGRVSHSSLFLIRVTGGMPDTRIASVAPKKAAKTAVTRNKVRRKMYEAIHSMRGGLKVGIHAIVFAKPGIVEKKPADIQIDLQSLFVKAGILR